MCVYLEEKNRSLLENRHGSMAVIVWLRVIHLTYCRFIANTRSPKGSPIDFRFDGRVPKITRCFQLSLMTRLDIFDRSCTEGVSHKTLVLIKYLNSSWSRCRFTRSRDKGAGTDRKGGLLFSVMTSLSCSRYLDNGFESRHRPFRSRRHSILLVIPIK